MTQPTRLADPQNGPPLRVVYLTECGRDFEVQLERGLDLRWRGTTILVAVSGGDPVVLISQPHRETALIFIELRGRIRKAIVQAGVRSVPAVVAQPGSRAAQIRARMRARGVLVPGPSR